MNAINDHWRARRPHEAMEIHSLACRCKTCCGPRRPSPLLVEEVRTQRRLDLFVRGCVYGGAAVTLTIFAGAVMRAFA